jgi:hypothetical protein
MDGACLHLSKQSMITRPYSRKPGLTLPETTLIEISIVI